MKNILLTGIPRVGKTTIICTIIEKLRTKCAGFYTEEIRKNNDRIGFKLITLDDKSCTLARKKFRSQYRVGKYGVDIGCIEGIGVTTIRKGIEEKKIIIIDEIGKMELFSDAFREVVVGALDSPYPVLGTILLRQHSFCEEIKSRCDVEIIEVTGDNRTLLPMRILKKLCG
jgi:nucleoside-triphosphatase